MYKYFMLALMITSPVFAADIATEKVLLRGVDKITSRVSTMEGVVGQSVSFGDLTINTEKCFTKPPEEAPENAAFLTITQKEADGSVKEVFNGWMFSSNPALSSMEHPVYDVWVLSCVTGKKAIPTAFNEKVKVAVQSTDPDESDMNLVADEDNPALADEMDRGDNRSAEIVHVDQVPHE